MSRPPLGTRWGDLSPEQRAALPVGTRLLAFDGIPELAFTDWGGWVDVGCRIFYYSPSPHQLIVYPDPTPEPDPRDSDGSGSDEGGGEAKGGDNDHDGDVPEVARRQTRTGKLIPPGYDFAVARRPWGMWWQVLTAYKTLAGAHRGCPDGRHVVNYRAVPGCSVVRLYWPPTCEGAEDAPRDCLEGA